MANNTENTRTANPTSTNFFGRIQTSIRSWWNGLLKPRKEEPVESILKNARQMLVVFTALAFLVMAGIVYFDLSCEHLAWVAEVLMIDFALEQFMYIDAIRTSKEERRNFEKNYGRSGRRLMIAAFVLVLVSVIITQNFLGIGDAVTTALPWTKTAAEAVLSFTNSTVEEFLASFK